MDSNLKHSMELSIELTRRLKAQIESAKGDVYQCIGGELRTEYLKANDMALDRVSELQEILRELYMRMQAISNLQQTL